MSDALRQDDKALLQSPTEQDLSRSFVVLGHKRLQQRIVSTCGANKRRICLKDYIALGAPLDNVRTSEPWVQLHLVDAENTSVVGRLLLKNVSTIFRRAATHSTCGSKNYLLPLLQLIEMMDAKVADSNSPDLALLHGLDQRLPGSQSTLCALVRCMKQV